jgi:hypothetical protein
MPETPWYYARKEQADKAIKTLNRIYKGVEDYDAEREYAVMIQEIEHERALKEVASKTSWMDLFRGVHLVSPAIATMVWKGSEAYIFCRNEPSLVYSAWRCRTGQEVLSSSTLLRVSTIVIVSICLS